MKQILILLLLAIFIQLSLAVRMLHFRSGQPYAERFRFVSSRSPIPQSYRPRNVFGNRDIGMLRRYAPELFYRPNPDPQAGMQLNTPASAFMNRQPFAPDIPSLQPPDFTYNPSHLQRPFSSLPYFGRGQPNLPDASILAPFPSIGVLGNPSASAESQQQSNPDGRSANAGGPQPPRMPFTSPLNEPEAKDGGFDLPKMEAAPAPPKLPEPPAVVNGH